MYVEPNILYSEAITTASSLNSSVAQHDEIYVNTITKNQVKTDWRRWGMA